MTVAPDEMVGGRGNDGDGLPVFGPNAWMKAVSAAIPARRRADDYLRGLKRPCRSLEI